jgi:hypothetical protein
VAAAAVHTLQAAQGERGGSDVVSRCCTRRSLVRCSLCPPHRLRPGPPACHSLLNSKRPRCSCSQAVHTTQHGRRLNAAAHNQHIKGKHHFIWQLLKCSWRSVPQILPVIGSAGPTPSPPRPAHPGLPTHLARCRRPLFLVAADFGCPRGQSMATGQLAAAACPSI